MSTERESKAYRRKIQVGAAKTSCLFEEKNIYLLLQNLFTHVLKIEEKQRLKAEEKEKQRIEDEKEYNRIMAQQARIKAELEEEEKKKKAKEEVGRQINNDEGKRVANEKSKNQETVNSPRKPNKIGSKSKARINEDYQAPPVVAEFRSNSPPVPAAAKKINVAHNKEPHKPSNLKAQKSDTTADYYVTESRLNLATVIKKQIQLLFRNSNI